MAENKINSMSVLQKKILFTLFCLAVYRIGVHIPTPGVDGLAVSEFFKTKTTGIFGFFNTFTGGALSQFSILALGIMPYISASIIFQLLTSAIPFLESLKKAGEAGRKKISQYTKIATIFLAAIQGYGISSWLASETLSDGRLLVSGGLLGVYSFKFVTVLTLIAGTAFVIWLSDQITEKGIGNGSSMIIFSGIAAGIPSGAANLWQLIVSEQIKFLVAIVIGFHGSRYFCCYLHGSSTKENFNSL